MVTTHGGVTHSLMSFGYWLTKAHSIGQTTCVYHQNYFLSFLFPFLGGRNNCINMAQSLIMISHMAWGRQGLSVIFPLCDKMPWPKLLKRGALAHGPRVTGSIRWTESEWATTTVMSRGQMQSHHLLFLNLCICGSGIWSGAGRRI